MVPHWWFTDPCEIGIISPTLQERMVQCHEVSLGQVGTWIQSPGYYWILPEKNEGKRETAFLKTPNFLQSIKAAKWSRFWFHSSSHHCLPGPCLQAEALLLKTISDPLLSANSGPANPAPLMAPQHLSFPFIHSVCLRWARLCASVLPGTAPLPRRSPACSTTCPHPPRLRASSSGTFTQKTHPPPTCSRNICYGLIILYLTFSHAA